MSAAAASISMWAWGFVIAFFMRRQKNDPLSLGMVKGLSLTPLCGPGILSVAWFFALYLDRPSYMPAMFLAIGIGAALLGRLLTRRVSTVVQPSVSRWVLLPMVTSVLLVAASCYLNSSRPFGGSDSMAIWNYAARFLYRSGAAYADLMPVLDPSHHMDYPLFIPAAISAQWYMAGGESWHIIHWTHAGFLLPLACLAFEILSSCRSPRLAALTSTAILVTPAILTWSQRQYVDQHLAYATLGGVGGLALLVRDNKTPPLAGWSVGLFLGAMPWLKNEGIPLTLLALLLFILVSRIQGRLKAQGGALVRITAGLCFFVIPLIVFKQSWPPTNDLMARGGETFFSYLTDPARWQEVLVAYGAEFNPRIPLSRRRWGASLVLLPLFFGVGVWRCCWRRSPENQFTLLFVILASIGWILVYVLTPQALTWHLETSMNRLVLQLFPAFLTFSVLCATTPRRRRVDGLD